MNYGACMKKPDLKKVVEAIGRAVLYFGGEQIDLAKAIGVDKSLISHWKSGKAKIPFDTALEIENKTLGNITVEELMPHLGDVLNNRLAKLKRHKKQKHFHSP